MLFNGDSFLTQVVGFGVIKNLYHDKIISLEIFSEYERQYLNKIKENRIFLMENTDTELRNCAKMWRIIKPHIFYYPDRYEKVMTILKPHRHRKFSNFSISPGSP